jgi:RNA polymerase sigma-70 factor, ECF subfamily
MPSNSPALATMPAFHPPLEALDDKALVVAAQSGNALAFIELCQRHSKKLMRRINRITKNWEDAQDALQDTFLRAYRN